MCPCDAACKTSATRGKSHAVLYMLCVSIPSAYSGSGMRSITLLASELRDGTRDSVLALKTTCSAFLHAVLHTCSPAAMPPPFRVFRGLNSFPCNPCLPWTPNHTGSPATQSLIHHSSFIIHHSSLGTVPHTLKPCAITDTKITYWLTNSYLKQLRISNMPPKSHCLY